MAVYERSSGAHVAERVQPEPGSDDERRLQALADDPASDWRRVVDGPADDEQAPSGPPSKSAVKEEWVAWAVAQGADRAEAEKATKPDLIAAYGAPSPGDGQGPEE